MMSPVGIKRAKGEVFKPPYHTLPLYEPIIEAFVEKELHVMSIWMKAWYHIDKEEKKTLRGNQETSFNGLLGIIAAIVRELKEGTIEDYVDTLWEGVCMAKNGTKKGVTLDM